MRRWVIVAADQNVGRRPASRRIPEAGTQIIINGMPAAQATQACRVIAEPPGRLIGHAVLENLPVFRGQRRPLSETPGLSGRTKAAREVRGPRSAPIGRTNRGTSKEESWHPPPHVHRRHKSPAPRQRMNRTNYEMSLQPPSCLAQPCCFAQPLPGSRTSRRDRRTLRIRSPVSPPAAPRTRLRGTTAGSRHRPAPAARRGRAAASGSPTKAS